MWLLIYVAWMLVCWGHSMMPGELSSFESSRFVFLVRPFFLLAGITNERLMSHFVRKAAHFTEYAILGLLAKRVSDACFAERWKSNLMCAALVVGVPMADEFIQTFVPGRSGSIRDVLLDISGSVFSLTLSWIIRRVLQSRRRQPKHLRVT